MKEKIIKLLPEINLIKSTKLQEKVIAAYEDALKVGGWQPEDMDTIPFTLLIPGCPFSYLDHVRGVTKISYSAMTDFNSVYSVKYSKFTLDHDELIAGALLHDVGKLAEYEKLPDGTTVKSQLGKDLRHPFSGVAIALRNGCSTKICHMIANHSFEGDGVLRSPESVIIHNADFINFETTKSFLGMK